MHPRPIPLAAAPRLDEIRLADLTGDGVADVVAISCGRLVVLPGNGSGGFEAARPLPGTTRDPFELSNRDGDGAIDIVQVGSEVLLEHLNDGSGGLTKTVSSAFVADPAQVMRLPRPVAPW